ncbi:hypothetical protein H5410_043242 [Solanum commersonii]|uniref:Uncharacterized protein n=1 Tax=Solanum commersonii TaxID=4109 RepID=A0A9J5XZQ0_SOLCO|nr:hypothetical protein H5410_043242 [Solanum commersonii]
MSCSNWISNLWEWTLHILSTIPVLTISIRAQLDSNAGNNYQLPLYRTLPTVTDTSIEVDQDFMSSTTVIFPFHNVLVKLLMNQSVNVSSKSHKHFLIGNEYPAAPPCTPMSFSPVSSFQIPANPEKQWRLQQPRPIPLFQKFLIPSLVSGEKDRVGNKSRQVLRVESGKETDFHPLKPKLTQWCRSFPVELVVLVWLLRES